MIINNLSVFFATFISLFFFRKIAKVINLVDTPNERKRHIGAVPLVGGLSIFAIVFSYLYTFPTTLTNSYIYLSCAGLLLLIGVLDDLKNLGFNMRLTIQAFMSLVMMFNGELVLVNLGNLFGPFELVIPNLGYLLTFIAIIGAINAFNMVDGIDGLLGGMTTITFGAMSVLFMFSGHIQLFSFSIAIVIATIPYILMNLGIPFGQKFKVFMGDAGSTVIGFTVVWLLIEGSQGPSRSFQAVTGLWLAAVPIIDALSTIFRRIRKKQSPFKPDREHLHHILIRFGFSPKLALITICIIAGVFSLIGIASEILNVPSYIMFWSFVGINIIYFFVMTRIWRITVKVRRYFGITSKFNKKD
ncbi:undecaprenyl-phosphate alpha-N-acetylglucosaminyl 1-phosphate transferase [Pseudoalteromonas aliena]|uniref:Undecaprenyl-phosphate alpha-N-acetylglucosaminyl 1-phosphate transferase n=1 Tax=Pseudoalteromonas aliena TaxID=247523 RepID=A0A1Q2GWC0_9GAMM|nr:UDP-N-acetylglucosamine--undecaprenyl-phosphate N-acetylglucosaminephosphotransferase [Pseudoalteromonas aliena]AQP99403.1 undecaprenyl-phosphate alpha-N-acetylglucosaminyl 1-phosphate transferase [Pseudoalteromonas aliena]